MSRFAFLFLLVIVGLVASTGGPVIADGPEQPHSEEGLVPGIGGYKVFGPNAVRIEPVKSIYNDSISPMVLYRAGYSDAYLISTHTYGGSHTSQSDLVEQQIWTDGGLKKSGDTGWRDTCSLHQGGQFASCNTDYTGDRPTIAHSWHFFHKTGYVDSNFQTEDTYN